MDIKLPEQFTTLQVVGVQSLPGRRTEHVRVFCVNPNDPDTKVVEVALSPEDAVEIIQAAHRDGAFPEIKVPSRAIVKTLSTRETDIIRMEQRSGPDYPNRDGA